MTASQEPQTTEVIAPQEQQTETETVQETPTPQADVQPKQTHLVS